MARRARWTMDGPPGSAFHEIIVLPTVAPQLARVSRVSGAQVADGVPGGGNEGAYSISHRLMSFS